MQMASPPAFGITCGTDRRWATPGFRREVDPCSPLEDLLHAERGADPPHLCLPPGLYSLLAPSVQGAFAQLAGPGGGEG